MDIKTEREERLQMSWVLGDKQARVVELSVMAGAEIWPVGVRQPVVFFFDAFPLPAKFLLKRHLCQLC